MSRALIIVDVQNDFCEGGSLAVAGGTAVATAVSAALADPPATDSGATRRRRRSWDHVVATKDYHVDPGPHFGDPPDFVDSWPVHCLAGTPGSDFHPALDTDRIEAVFTKGEHAAAYSGFQGHIAGLSLAAWLRMHDVREVDVVGIATDHCVRATALDAVAAGFTTTVRLNLTAGIARSTVDDAVARMRQAGVHLIGKPRLRARTS